MMKYVYHGTSVKNLKVIKPINKFVYATPVRKIAIIFISPLGSDLYYSLFGDGVDYPIELVERKAGMFKKIFNCSGYIYKLNSVNFTSEFTAWTAEVVSMKKEKVISCEYIDNVYDELIKLNDLNKIKLYLYPNRPSKVPDDNSDLIPKIIKRIKTGFDVNKFYDLYPELKNEFIKFLKKDV